MQSYFEKQTLIVCTDPELAMFCAMPKGNIIKTTDQIKHDSLLPNFFAEVIITKKATHSIGMRNQFMRGLFKFHIRKGKGIWNRSD